MAARRSTAACDSQLLALATSRPGTCAPSCARQAADHRPRIVHRSASVARADAVAGCAVRPAPGGSATTAAAAAPPPHPARRAARCRTGGSPGVARAARLNWRIGDHRVRGAEVDADAVGRRHHARCRARCGPSSAPAPRAPARRARRIRPSSARRPGAATASSSSVPTSVTRGVQPHRHHVAGAAAFGGQRGLNIASSSCSSSRLPDVEQGADVVLAPHRRAEEAEAHRLADHQAELLRAAARPRCPLPCRTARRTAPAPAARHAGHGRHRRSRRRRSTRSAVPPRMRTPWPRRT